MMRYLLVLLLFFSYLEGVPSSFESEDPTTVHHVNVISGHLSLFFEDFYIRGAVPLSIQRSYSSAGALERSRQNIDLILNAIQGGWLFQGGWAFFPHTNLFIEASSDFKQYQIFLSEPSGQQVLYTYSCKENKHTIHLKPSEGVPQCSGKICARNNPENHRLMLDLKKGEAILHLANGGRRIYRGRKLFPLPDKIIHKYCYFLEEEILPSQHKISFHYEIHKNKKSESRYLKRIETKSPSHQKTYAFIDFTGGGSSPLELRLNTSDGQTNILYRHTLFEEREYLNFVGSGSRPIEMIDLSPGRKGIGARLTSLRLNGKRPFIASYYMPPDEKKERKWAEKPEQKDFPIDKVKTIEAPVGPNGLMVVVARFEYVPGRTDVYDAEGLLTRYHYSADKLQLIEYFDEKGKIYCSHRFYWEGSYLCSKVFLDASGRPVFGKRFSYKDGNVIKEVLFGNLTGRQTAALQVDGRGYLSGGESHTKTYVYSEDAFHLLIHETEEAGPSYEYRYKPGTDLLEAKFTKDEQGAILKREFFCYDKNHLLYAEIIDDGVSTSFTDFNHISYRQEKHYSIDPPTGLITTISEKYWEPTSQRFLTLKTTHLKYQNNQVVEEEIYDSEGAYAYTLYTEYDRFKEVSKKKTPLGEYRYSYGFPGLIHKSKEIGSSEKIFTYDEAGREIGCLDEERGITTCRTYDAKGRVITEDDGKGNVTRHTYDVFGNRIQTLFPETETGQALTSFKYDILGNIVEAILPLGEKTKTTYNLLRKPISITHPDGSWLFHTYHLNGTLAESLYPDGSRACYTYDLFQRMTSKKLFSSKGELLSEESWIYSTFHLLAHTDEKGLTTTFTYDAFGRKTEEKLSNVCLFYTYDSLGFLERVDNGHFTHVTKHNLGGQITAQWDEDAQGRIENKMFFFYDKEGRKKKAVRFTSEGEATDTFSYHKGLLERHTDPLGSETCHFSYETFKNESGQQVLQKQVIDPLGNILQETYDTAGRPVLIEKVDHKGNLVFREQFFYDLSGNLVKRVTPVFAGLEQLRTTTVTWKYDPMGRVIEENEQNEKITQYAYDGKGRLVTKTLPNQTTLSYVYDELDRQTRLSSSDGSIDVEWIYGRGPLPIQSINHVQGITIERSYDLLGQLIEEKSSSGLGLKWSYDSLGRVSMVVLPDQSSIYYRHEGLHLRRIERWRADGTLFYEHEYTHFDPNGHVAEEKPIFNLPKITTTHDLMERPSVFTSPWMDHSLHYGPSGLIINRQNTLFGEKSYQHDPLNQLIQEGEDVYLFDSLGNPAEHTINSLNQVVSTSDTLFKYDQNGNLTQKMSKHGVIFYRYDALGKLIEILYPQVKKIVYSYDPFSRLFAKEVYLYNEGAWNRVNRRFFLYDQDKEVGTVDEKGSLIEFKTLGLGIKKDIGAAIALEVHGDVYLPLHDFSGNIVALICRDGSLVEKYEMNSFGKESSTAPPLTPWRFCSKRSEEGLVFFGLRFYDPSLGRWISPDPSGFADGSNLYAYVLNNPLRRLDLFGLYSEDSFGFPKVEVYMSIPQYFSLPSIGGLCCQGKINGVDVDFYVFHTSWHKFQFSAEEKARGQADILDHLHELIPSEGNQIAFATFGNGIDTNLDRFSEASEYLGYAMHGPLMINLHNPTEGIFKDLGRVNQEKKGVETPIVSKMRQFLSYMAERIEKINPNAQWLSLNHSENGLIIKRAIEGALPEDQARFRNALHILAVGPADCVPRTYGASAVNLYSDKDYVTGFGTFGYAKKYMNHPDFELKVLRCETSWMERNFFIADHGFLGTTYRNGLGDYIKQMHDKIGIHGRGFNEQSR